jgi:uncharacterized protein
MISRILSKELKEVAKYFPVVSVYGPRQSGKTTLTRMTFPDYKYVNLENPNIRKMILQDPRDFLEQVSKEEGVILDEIQNTPDLLSYIQTYVDEHEKTGFFILTGSHNLLLNQSISQSLAGRVAILTLLPFSIDELRKKNILPESELTSVLHGFYPRVIAEKQPYQKWYSSYINTYVERDVRQLQNITNLSLFQDFIGLCAGRIGQLLNITALANDCGISVNTAKGWLSLLESSYIIFTLRPYYKNFNKRIVKSPKIYFYDTGLACSLLGIETEEQLAKHYLRGGLFESFILSDLRKKFYNKDKRPSMYFWRDHQGLEVDCVIERANKLTPIEIKSSKTMNTAFFDEISTWNKISKNDPKDSFVVYAGKDPHIFKKISLISWNQIDKILD